MIFPILILFVSAFVPQDHDVQASPFDGVRWAKGLPEVRIGEEWYAPVAIDGLSVTDIIAFCDDRWPGQREKRFAEDLVEAMVELDWEGDLKVDLDLVSVDGGEKVRLESVEMTRDKRNALRDASKDRVRPRRSSTPATVPIEAAFRDIQAFGGGLHDQFAYLGLGDVDLESELGRIRDGLAGPHVDVLSLGEKLQELLMKFGDGHASVRSSLRRGSGGDTYLPFLLVQTSIGVVAVRPDRSGLVEPEAPVVQGMDGRPLEEWIEAVRPGIAHGSPQLILRRALGSLREIDEVRRAMGMVPRAPLSVTFASADGSASIVREIKTSDRRPTYGDWPRSSHRILDGNIGYLRIPEMDDEVEPLRRAMDDFSDTKGLIVDVRGNGGGTREILLALGGYWIGPEEPAVVGNVAKYRLSRRFGEDHLEARYMHRADWSGWNERQRAAIEGVRADFEPEWTPAGEFSEWHYLVLDRTGHDAEYFYDRPVVVLSDAGCFSATDIFLGAVELLPRVTLVGTASSGGSARSQSFSLPETRMEVRCASMASFRPDGRLYDGRGVEVDVEVLPEPGDFLSGGGDAQLRAALEMF